MPATSSSNLVKIGFIQETAFGVTPVTGNPNALRFTGESLDYAVTTDTSKEIRADRSVSDLIQTGASVSGSVNFELSYKEYDPFIQAVLGGTFVSYGTGGIGAAVALTLNSTAGTITAASAPTGADAFSGLAVGQWFRLKAPTDAADGAFMKLASATSTILTVDVSTPIPGTGTRAAVAGCQISASRVANGTTNRTFSIEKGFTDVNQFFNFSGCGISKTSLSFTAGAIVTGSFDVMGKTSIRGTATQLPGSPIASQTFDVMNGVFGVGTIYEGGAALTGALVKEIKIDIDPKLRALLALGVLGAAQINLGTFEITGSMSVFLSDGSLYDKFVNQTASSVSWGCKDKANNGYQFTLPKVKYSDAKVVAGGLDQDAMIDLPFTAIFDPASGKTIFVDRLGA